MSRLVPPIAWTDATKSVPPLQSDLTSNDEYLPQHRHDLVVRNYPYGCIKQLMSRMRQSPTDDLHMTTRNAARSLPNSPRTHTSSNALTSRTMPNSPEEVFRDSPAFHSNNPHPEAPVLVQFESVSEWYRALEMVRSAEVDQDKVCSAGSQSRQHPVWTRLL